MCNGAIEVIKAINDCLPMNFDVARPLEPEHGKARGGKVFPAIRHIIDSHIRKICLPELQLIIMGIWNCRALNLDLQRFRLIDRVRTERGKILNIHNTSWLQRRAAGRK